MYSRADGSQYSYVTVVDTNAQKVTHEPAALGIAPTAKPD